MVIVAIFALYSHCGHTGCLLPIFCTNFTTGYFMSRFAVMGFAVLKKLFKGFNIYGHGGHLGYIPIFTNL